MMKALIVEDELMAQNQLARLLGQHFSDIEVVGATDSVCSTVDWLSRSGDPDIIFMDVELSDGNCFDIFRQRSVRSQVIMTTAYDSYALKAFEAGSVDYLLKPIDVKALGRAVARCRERSSSPDVEKMLQAIEASGRHTRYKERSVVRLGDKIIPVDTEDIAYFVSEDKSNFLVLLSGVKYVVDSTIDLLDAKLDPEKFFRISRGCIVSRKAVRSISRHLNGRLRLDLGQNPGEEIFVSRSRVEDFLSWLE